MAKSFREHCLETYYQAEWNASDFDGCQCCRSAVFPDFVIVIEDYGKVITVKDLILPAGTFSFDSPEVKILAKKFHEDFAELEEDGETYIDILRDAIYDGGKLESCHCYRCPLFDDCEMWDDAPNCWNAEKEDFEA